MRSWIPRIFPQPVGELIHDEEMLRNVTPGGIGNTGFSEEVLIWQGIFNITGEGMD